MRKTVRLGRPSCILATLGGAAGVLFFAAAVALGPGGGAAARATAEGAGAPWAGVILLFLAGWLVLPLALVAAWKALPGDPLSLPGALLRGALFGLGAWVLAGVVAPVAADGAGLFGSGLGIGGALSLLVGALGYGLITAAVASMGRGMAPLEIMGWEGHGSGRAA